jgi:nucleotide-binding universal stress UspA family protein
VAAKSQIEIDVNSAEFVEFKAKFDKYYETLKTVPDAWAKISQSTAVAKTNFESMAAGMAVVGSSFATITAGSKEFFTVTTATARHWKDLAVSTGSVAKNIVAATESLIKWTGILSLVTGGAGLFGFDRLAHSVASQRTSALGTGTDYGSRAAFLTNFRRLGDPEGLLGRVSEDVSNMGTQLRKLGLSAADLKGDTSDITLKALRRGAQIASKTRVDLLDVIPQLQVFSHEERMRLNAHPEEIEEMAKGFQQERGTGPGKLGLSPQDQLAYTNFTTQLEKAGRQIETIFVKGLVKLADPLGKLSQDVINLAEKFTAKDGPLDHLITDLGKGIEWLAGEIDKPEFQKTVSGFIEEIGSLAASLVGLVKGLANFAHWLGVGTVGSSGTPGSLGSLSDAPAADKSTALGRVSEQREKFGHRTSGGGGGGSGAISGSATPGWWTAERQQHAYDRLTKEGHLSDAGARGLISRWVNVESSGGPNSRNAIGGGHYGIGQWSRSRAGSVWGNPDVDAQLDLTMKELNSTELAAGKRLRDAKTSEEGAIGASSFERAEHYNRATGRDDWTNKTESGMGRIPVARNKVTVTSTPGGNTVNGANAAAAGSP